jgi:hypothetical protein
MPYKDPEKRRENKRKTNETYRNKNREALNAKALIKYHLNKPPPKPRPKKPPKTAEEIRAYRKEYYAKNREKLLKQMKERFEQNPNYHKEWRQKNKERIKEQRKKYRAKNREKINAQSLANEKKRFLTNPEKVRKARRLNKAKQKAKDPQKYNAKCNERYKRMYKKMSAELRDSYIKLLLTRKETPGRIPVDCIPQELIEAKRAVIQIRRYLNEERN